MIERVKTVANPLTTIAIFAALAEVASTVSLGLIAPPLQAVFIYFVMAFPAVLVVLFFLALFLKPQILYGPGDYKNEENFLHLVRGTLHLTTALDPVKQALDALKADIETLKRSTKEESSPDEETQRKAVRDLAVHVSRIEQGLGEVQAQANNVIISATGRVGGLPDVDMKILRYLSSSAMQEHHPSEIAEAAAISLDQAEIRLRGLRDWGLVFLASGEGNAQLYHLTAEGRKVVLSNFPA